MSTEFDVFPTIPRIPTFGEVLERTQTHLFSFLRDYGVREVPVLCMANVNFNGLLDGPSPFDRAARMDEPFWWSPSHYGWFSWEWAGGTDVYAWPIGDSRDMYEWNDPHATERERAFAAEMEKAFAIDRYWSFRRSASSTGFLSLAYGMLAGSLAELVEGIIYTDDGAWDHRLFPMRAAEFLPLYFRPELSQKPEEADWARRCINGFAEDLTGTWRDDDEK